MIKFLGEKMSSISGFCDFITSTFHSSDEQYHTKRNGVNYILLFSGEIFEIENTPATQNTPTRLLDLFLQYGTRFVHKLNGNFSIVIWDDGSKRLYLFRDRLGVKNLFYTFQKSKAYFSTELLDLVKNPAINSPISKESLSHVLAVGPARIPGNGIYKNLHEVMAGHYNIISEYGTCDETYWDLTYTDNNENFDEIKKNVYDLLMDSIKNQSSSNGNACSLLSGGLDSSVVTAALNRNNINVPTFSFEFKDNSKYFTPNDFQPNQDHIFVDIFKARYPGEHTILTCDENELYDTLFDAMYMRSYPGMTDIDASLLFFCRKVKEMGYNIIFTGECSDELFGGYPWFYRSNLMNQNGFPWSYNCEYRFHFLSEEVIKALNLTDYFDDTYQTALARIDLPGDLSKEEKRRLEISYMTQKWFMPTLLERMGKVATATNTTARVPFADYKLAEYLFNVPWKYKYNNETEKHLLRDITKSILPDEISTRKKSPYPKTYHPGYTALLKTKMKDILNTPSSPLLYLVDKNKVLDFMENDKNLSQPWFGQLMAGPQLLAYYISINDWLQAFNLDLPI